MSEKSPLPSHIHGMLAELRRRIRMYVWLEGLALGVIWLALTFWLAMLVDFVILVRWLGISELSQPARVVVLISIAATLGVILYRWIFRRTFVQLSDRNLALLLERRFDTFHDSLVTAVEMTEQPDHAEEFNPEMLQHTHLEAELHTDGVRVADVLNWRRLGMMGMVAIVLVLPAGILFAVSPTTVNTLARRIYALQDVRWPRKSEIEVVGLEIQRAQSLARTETAGSMLSFEEKKIKVARGSKLNLWVRANAEEKEVPEYCTIYYRVSGDNERTRGRRNMKKIGSKDSGYQRFSFDDKPLEGILDDVRFDVKGRDHWVRGFRIEVVDNPTINEVVMDYKYPAYTGRAAVTDDAYTRGKPLPRGTDVTFKFRANKPLQQAVLYDPQQQKQFAIVMASAKTTDDKTVAITLTIPADVGDSGRAAVAELEADFELRDRTSNQPLLLSLEEDQLMVQTEGSSTPSPLGSGIEVKLVSSTGEQVVGLAQASPDGQSFQYRIKRLDEDTNLQVSLFDLDGVVTEEPFNVTLAATPDEAPDVQSQLTGIGPIITPDAIIPVSGEIKDDWGVAQSRLEIVVNQSAPHQVPFKLDREKIKTSFDFRLARQDGKFELEPTDKLVLNVIAEDASTLDGEPNRGEGAAFEIEVVTPDELLSALERRELSLRQNFEKIVGEVQELRDSLARIEEGLRLGDKAAANAAAEPGEKKITPEEFAKRAHGFRVRLVQGAMATSETAARETLGVAESFDAIREELINNRVDAAEREKRLREDIANPLKDIAKKEFSVLDETLRDLEKQMGTDISKTTAKVALNKAEYILAEMEGVLEKMLELEDFNDLLKIVRDLIESHKELMDKTKKVQRQDLIDLLK